MGIDATIVDQWIDKRLHIVGTLAFSGNYATGGVTVNFAAGGIRSDRPPVFVSVPLYQGFSFEYAPGASSREGKLKVYGSGSVAATSTLTSNNTNVANNDTVVINGRTYTFKTNLTASTTANEVKIGADADASLLNLIHAINNTGTPGTDYGSLTTINADVSAASSVTAHAFLVTAKVAGTAGNAITTTTPVGATLSWTGATLANGANQSANGSELSAAAFPTNLASFTVPFYAIFYQFQ